MQYGDLTVLHLKEVWKVISDIAESENNPVGFPPFHFLMTFLIMRGDFASHCGLYYG